MWKLIAWILSRNAVATAIINRALRTPYFHLPSNEDPSYMERYWVFNPYFRANNEQTASKYPWFPWNIRIHWIKRADRERHLHDHPWHARTIILRGWYFEERAVQDPGCRPYGNLRWPAVRRCSGDTATIGYEQYHRITEVSEGGTWTLFISGPYQGVWGFLVDGVKVPFKKYLGLDKPTVDLWAPMGVMPDWKDAPEEADFLAAYEWGEDVRWVWAVQVSPGCYVRKDGSQYFFESNVITHLSSRRPTV